MDQRTLELLAFIKKHSFWDLKQNFVEAAGKYGMSNGEAMRLESSNQLRDILYTLYKMLDENEGHKNKNVAKNIILSLGANLGFLFKLGDSSKMLDICDNFDTYNILFELES